MKDVMRFTIVDPHEKISLVAPCHTLDVLVAACCSGPTSLDQLLHFCEPFASDLPEYVRCGLAVFDERNTPENYGAIHAALDFCKPQDLPVFRIVDERTRQASLQPVRAGLVLFNLIDRRIVQIQNTYAEIKRKGRVRIMKGSSPTNQLRRYELPPDWTLVPSR